MIYELPVSVDVGGTSYDIRTDYRAVMDIFTALSANDLSEAEKVYVILNIFYVDFEKMPKSGYQEALDKCFWFVNCGEDEESGKTQKLMDWEQDFSYIVAPINRTIGKDVRAVEYMHWWSFMAAFMEIGDCYFAQLVRIRSLKAKGRRLDKEDQEFYRKNKSRVDIKHKYTKEEMDVLKKWTGGKG